MFSGNPERVLSFAHRAEELGYDGVFGFDHFFPPGAAPDRPSLELFTTLAAIAVSTSRLAMGSLVTRAQLRPAGLLARMAADLDRMSGGRMVLGIGTGDPIDEPEHRAFGLRSLDKTERRVHLEETVRAVKALLGGVPWEGGRHVPPTAGPVVPPPHREGGPPVWLGAQADAVIRLAGRIADGWNGWGIGPEEFARKAGVLAAEAEAAGRRAEPTWAGIALVGEDEGEAHRLAETRRSKGMPDDGLWVGGAERFSAFLRDLADAGATWTVLVPAGPPDRVEVIARAAMATRS
ncbi:MAG: LLM class flavin-dependent oxidoreductase [Actinomycetota bacterium]|nr:LLM class flavin-dependent oxidoreductase [Actinomycetota bacterium]